MSISFIRKATNRINYNIGHWIHCRQYSILEYDDNDYGIEAPLLQHSAVMGSSSVNDGFSSDNEDMQERFPDSY